jgi:exodeoxyribonuclease V gamma subunit
VGSAPALLHHRAAAARPAWRTPTLAQLIEFFRHPARYLLRRRLGLALVREADELRDDEPFVPDREAHWALADRLLPSLLADADLRDAAAPGRGRHRLAGRCAGTRTAAAGCWMRCSPLRRARTRRRRRAAAAAARGDDGLRPRRRDAGSSPLAHGDLRATGLVRWRAAGAAPAPIASKPGCTTCGFAANPPPGGATPTRWLAQDGTPGAASARRRPEAARTRSSPRCCACIAAG